MQLSPSSNLHVHWNLYNLRFASVREIKPATLDMIELSHTSKNSSQINIKFSYLDTIIFEMDFLFGQ